MTSDPCIRARHTLAVLGALLLLATAATRAQTVTAPALKAAFLFNFAKFAEWPAETTPPDVLTLCVLGDTAVADALDETVNGRSIENRGLVVWRVKADSPLRSCQLLYLSGLDERRATQVLESLQGAAVLTVSDAERFAESGGVAQFYVLDGRMRFAINVEAARRARLRISSKMLSLARLVQAERHAQH